jgi:dimethylglycine dehydrogenase
LALGLVKSAFAAEGTELEIEILGQKHRATVVAESAFDPDNNALRS